MASVWPYVPLPQIEERLSFLTSEHYRRDDVSRWALRTTPRQELRMGFSFLSADWEEARALFEGNVLGTWQVPCWHEGTRIAVDTADTVLSVSTDAEYVVGGNVIIWGGCASYTVAEVSVVGSGSITLTGAVGTTYASANVMPLRNCFVRGGMEASRSSANHYQASITFEATDNELISGTLVDFSTYPFFECSGAVLSPHGGAIQRAAVYVDSGRGPVSIEPTRTVVEEFGTVTVAAATASERWKFKELLHAVQGKDAPFWITEKVARITSSTTTTAVIPALRNDPADWIGETVEFSGVSRTITAGVTSGTGHQVTFAALGSAPTGVMRVLRLVRGADDTVSLIHNHRMGVTRATFGVKT